MATNFKSLNNFQKKLEKYGNINSNFENEVVDEVCKLGVQIAMQEYAGVKGVSVRHEVGNGIGKIIAEKEGIAYIEFGTGRVGEKSGYDRRYLPQSGVPITGKWQYYYDSEHKTTKDGKEGWYAGKNFMVGIPAGTQMYKTSRKLRYEMGKVLKNKIKGDGKSV